MRAKIQTIVLAIALTTVVACSSQRQPSPTSPLAPPETLELTSELPSLEAGEMLAVPDRPAVATNDRTDDPASSRGPARFDLDPDRPFAPVTPAGITTRESPVILSEPLALHNPAPLGPTTQGITAFDVPMPARPAPRSQRVEQQVDDGGSVESSSSAITIGGPPPTPLVPPFVSTFDSTDFDDNPPLNSGSIFIPPDPIGAVGPSHVANVVNTTIRFHTKGGTTTFHSGLASFFASLGPLTPTFDPKIIYDQFAQRFVVVTLERTDVLLGDAADTSRILVAVSDDSDPNGTWHMASINSATMIGGVDHWADYPGFAVDEEAVYITNNMFSFFSSGGSFGGVRLWVIDKFAGAGGGFYGGGTTMVSTFDPYAGGGIAVTTQPAHVFGTAPSAPTNVGTWLVSYSGLTGGGSEFLQFVRIDDPVGPGATTFTQQFLNIGNIETLVAALPEAPQSGTAETVATNDRRALHAVWRDDNSLWTVATIDPFAGPDAGESTAHWWQLDTTTLASVTLVQQGDVSGDDLSSDAHTFFPSIAVNSANDVAIGYSISSPTIFPSSAYTTRSTGDPAGTTMGTTLLRTGLASYIRTFDSPPCSTPPALNRWGDYSGVALDPVDQCFWVYNEHAITQGTGTVGGCNGRPNPETGRWGTAWGRACICSNTFSLTQDAWKQISLTCDPGSSNTVGQVFGDDLAGTYDTNWVVYQRDESVPQYVKMATTDTLQVGKGYWIKTNLASQGVANEGIANTLIDVPLTGVASAPPAGCGSSAGQCNKVGHPHNFDVCWADVLVIDGGSMLSLSGADPGGSCQTTGAGCIMSRIAHKWTGASYAPFDGTTPGMEGTLVPWDGFWVSANKPGIELRIPATLATTPPCGPPAATFGTRPSSFATETDRPAHPWFIRLTASNGLLEDSANVLGLLAGSKRSYDARDLIELDPFGSDYLTVVFSKPNWGKLSGNYASDYRSLSSTRENWRFEVRASRPGQRVTLTWEGPAEQLADSKLYDRTTGRRVRLQDGSYVFTMKGTSQTFLWKYNASGGVN